MHISYGAIFLPCFYNGFNDALWDVQSVRTNYVMAAGCTITNLGDSEQQGVNTYARTTFS